MYIFFCESFPKVYNIALICDGNDFLAFYSFSDARYELVEVGMDLIDPALALSLVCSMRVDLSANAYYA